MKKKLTGTLIFLSLVHLGCGEGDVTVPVDLFSFLDAATVSYQSEIFTVPGSVPLNQDLPPSSSLSFTARTIPAQINLRAAGGDMVEISKTLVRLRMEIEPQNFSGAATLNLYLSIHTNVYQDQSVVRISEKKLLPATFDLSGSDPSLNTMFLQEEIFVGFEVVFEPSRITDHQVAVEGLVESFEAEVTGKRAVY